MTGRTLSARIAALSRMPRCEPLARFPNEPLFRIDSPEYNDEGPSLWLRENGERMIASSDPCLGFDDSSGQVSRSQNMSKSRKLPRIPPSTATAIPTTG